MVYQRGDGLELGANHGLSICPPGDTEGPLVAAGLNAPNLLGGGGLGLALPCVLAGHAEPHVHHRLQPQGAALAEGAVVLLLGHDAVLHRPQLDAEHVVRHMQARHKGVAEVG